MERQNKTLELEKFENTFFNLAKAFFSVRENFFWSKEIFPNRSSVIYHSKDALHKIAMMLKYSEKLENELNKNPNEIRRIREMIDEAEKSLNDYFNVLVFITKFVINSRIKNIDFFLNFVRSILSSDELDIIKHFNKNSRFDKVLITFLENAK